MFKTRIDPIIGIERPIITTICTGFGHRPTIEIDPPAEYVGAFAKYFMLANLSFIKMSELDQTRSQATSSVMTFAQLGTLDVIIKYVVRDQRPPRARQKMCALNDL